MRILIAEDDPKLLKSLVHIFELNNYAVDGVDNGNDAFDFASSNEYDGIVLDIMMPGTDGVTLLRKLRSGGITTPALSRMDEEEQRMNIGEVSFGELVFDTVAEFEPLAKCGGKMLTATVDRSVTCSADEALLYRLVGILMDNAVKYCDRGGEIKVTLYRGRRIVLSVENTYAAVNELELNRLFDRFYRADKARRFTGGYGVGLSMAKAIAEKHRGEITAYEKDGTHIGFKVVL